MDDPADRRPGRSASSPLLGQDRPGAGRDLAGGRVAEHLLEPRGALALAEELGVEVVELHAGEGDDIRRRDDNDGGRRDGEEAVGAGGVRGGWARARGAGGDERGEGGGGAVRGVDGSGRRVAAAAAEESKARRRAGWLDFHHVDGGHVEAQHWAELVVLDRGGVDFHGVGVRRGGCVDGGCGGE